MDQALLFGGEQAHHGRLDYRDEGHVRVCRDRDGAEQVGCQLTGQEDRGRAVGAADDTDGTGFGGGEAQRERPHVSGENTDLCGGADQHQLRIRNQCREVGHGTDAEEDQRRVYTFNNAEIEVIQYGTVFVDADFHTGREWDVTHQDTESDRDEQHRLKVSADGQVEEKQTYADYDQLS